MRAHDATVKSKGAVAGVTEGSSPAEAFAFGNGSREKAVAVFGIKHPAIMDYVLPACNARRTTPGVHCSIDGWSSGQVFCQQVSASG